MKCIPIVLLMAAGLAQGQEALSLKGRIELGNVEGRIDHLSADVSGGRLFISALGNHSVEVLDARGLKRIRTITDLAEPQGVYYDASTNRLFVASAGDGTVKTFDGSVFRLLQTAKFSSDADNLRYDARDRRVLVGYGEGALAFLDPDGKKESEISMDAHPESFQLEKKGNRAFVNVPDRREIEVLDLVKKTVLAHWPVTAAASNFPMALDENHGRLFVGCRAPARLLVIDTASGKVTDSTAIVGDTDDLFFDTARNRVYVIGGEGLVDVLEERSGRYIRVARLATAAGARTGLFVPEWGELFVAAPHRGSHQAEVLVYQTK